MYTIELQIVKLIQAVLAERELIEREHQLKSTYEELKVQAQQAANEVAQFRVCSIFSFDLLVDMNMSIRVGLFFGNYSKNIITNLFGKLYVY